MPNESSESRRRPENGEARRSTAGAEPRRRPTENGSAPRKRPAEGNERPVRRLNPDGTPVRRTNPQGASGERPRTADGSVERRHPVNPASPPRRRRRRRRRKNYTPLILTFVAFLLVIAVCFAIGKALRKNGDSETVPTTEPTEPEIVHQVSTATITATGDVLMHLPVINTGLKADGSYDFTEIFQYVKPYTSASDYALANLETTLCSNNNGYKYSGFPCFNCPDAIVDALKSAGFDMLLTANNHCYDTLALGYKRTIEVIHNKGLENLGTMATPQDKKYAVKDLGGIKVGMMCYTYEQPVENPEAGIVYLNYIPMEAGSDQLINSFLPADPSPFYAEVQNYIRQMKQDGAEAIVMFIHWGIEYELTQNGSQRDMAQRLCDMGVDVIIGGHPHVVQPVQMLTSTANPEHKTLCLYSMGNAVSNQRMGNLTSIKTAHTEDGVLFSVTFSKYSDGTVYLDSAQLIPCWVKMDGTRETPEKYAILPLDDSVRAQWQSRYGLSDEEFNAAQQSYDRTMTIVGTGMDLAENYLAQAKIDRDNAYTGITEEAPEEPTVTDAAA